MWVLLWACKQIELPEIDEIFTLIYIQECIENGMAEDDIMRLFKIDPDQVPK